VQSGYPAQFSREQGFTETDWLSCLPGAVRGRPWCRPRDGQAVVEIGDGRLHMAWQPLAPRQIALIRIPRMAVSYRFEAVGDDTREAFMKYFDLFMQRGGG
jgi:hypothetical protein